MTIASPYITERAALGMFFERLSQATGIDWLEAICTTPITSDQDSEDYPWLGMVPQMNVKKGSKKFDQLLKTNWNVKNVEYQGGIKLPKKLIIYDKTTQVMSRLSELAVRSLSHWASLIAPLIVNGESTVCYDGQFYFDTDHTEGDSGTQSNDINADISTYPVSNAGTTTAPSPGEMIHAIMAGVQQMLAFKDDQGEYVNEGMTEFKVMMPISFLTAGLQAMSSSKIDGGSTNLLIEQDSFKFSVNVSPRLSSWTTKFVIFGTQGEQKPFIRQQRTPNNAAPGYDSNGLLIQTLWLDSEHCVKNDECLFSIETERAAAYGDWKKSCLVTLV